MDFGTLLVGLILTAICFFPVISSVVSRKRKENQYFGTLIKFAEKGNCRISQIDTCGDIVIGLDEKSNMLFFKNFNLDVIPKAFALKEVTFCKSNILQRKFQSPYGWQTAIQKLELNLVFKSLKEDSITLVFFDVEGDTMLSDELELLHKWEKIINARLSERGIEELPIRPQRKRA